MGLVEGERVAAVVGLGDRPAADVAAFRRAEAFDQLWTAGKLREEAMEARDAETDGEPRVAPAEFLADEEAQPHGLRGRDVGIGRFEGVEAEFAVAIEHLPEHRLLRDHVGRIRQLVELHASGPHHFLGELVGLIANRVFSLAELALDVDERHGRLL